MTKIMSADEKKKAAAKMMAEVSFSLVFRFASSLNEGRFQLRSLPKSCNIA